MRVSEQRQITNKNHVWQYWNSNQWKIEHSYDATSTLFVLPIVLRKGHLLIFIKLLTIFKVRESWLEKGFRIFYRPWCQFIKCWTYPRILFATCLAPPQCTACHNRASSAPPRQSSCRAWWSPPGGSRGRLFAIQCCFTRVPASDLRATSCHDWVPVG